MHSRAIFVLLTFLVTTLTPLAAFANAAEEIGRLIREEQYPLALERTDDALKQLPKDPQLRFFKGVVLAETGKTFEATKVFRDLANDNPELPEPYNNLAVLYASQGQYEKARIALELAIQTHPSYATAYENLGDVYTRLASSSYEKALQIDKGNSNAQAKLALIREIFPKTANTPSLPPFTPPKLADAGKKPPAPAAAPPAPPPEPSVVAKPAEPAAKTAPAPQTAPAIAPATPATPPAPSATAPATPATPPAPSAPAPADPVAAAPAQAEAAIPEAQIIRSVEAWAAAWARQDVNAYLAAYSRNFTPPGRLDRKSWEKERKERISAPKSITVKVSDFNLRPLADDRIQVRFKLDYRSSQLQSVVRKTLTLVKESGKWLILSEKASG